MFKRAPVAFRCTLMSFDFASFVKGPKAPDLAILALLSSWVARFVMHPTALHCTSTFGEFICLMSCVRPPSITIRTLFSALTISITISIIGYHQLLTARFPSAALAARCTSISGLCRRYNIGRKHSSLTSLTSLSVISANVRLALRCSSTFSE